MSLISFRPISDEDSEFLFQVYSSTREEELAQVPWSVAEKQHFLRMQFNAQHQHYQTHYPGAQFCVILQNGVAIGRLYLWKTQNEHRIVDIALLPPYRGQGFGTQIISDILKEAAHAQKTVRIHVEFNNPAKRLYERFGFKPIGGTGIYILMEWLPIRLT